MKKQLHKTWFKIEEIPKCNFGMIIPVFEKYGAMINKMGGSHNFDEVLWVYDNGIAKLHYLRNDFNVGINYLSNKVIIKPVWAHQVNKQFIIYNKEYYKYAKDIENLSFKNLSDKELIKILEKLVNLQRLSHNGGQIMTWLVDADKQLFSKHLIRILKNKVKSKAEVSTIFSLLTTPIKPSFTEIEYQKSLKIAIEISKNTKAKNLFINNNIDDIEKKLSEINDNLKKKMSNHWNKYLWLHYNYEGPILGFDYFLQIWKGLIKQYDVSKLKKMLAVSKQKSKIIKNQKNNYLNKLNLNKKEKQLFNIASDIVWLKSWRKDCMYFGSYVLDKIDQEIANRIGLTLKQIRFFCWWEIKDALINKKFNLEELDNRYKFSVIYTNSKNVLVFSGQKAHDYLDKITILKEEDKKVDKLNGMCACPGQAKGIVKIIETSDDMVKMNLGDILLSETTYPALVPAMFFEPYKH